MPMNFMESKEAMLYVITMISFIAFVYIFWTVSLKSPSISDKKFISSTGNVIFDLEDSFKVGDNIKGDIILNKDETSYGVLLLTKDNQPLITKTFNLNEIPKNKISSGYSIKIEDLIDYMFEEKGNYELFLSVLDLDTNIKREFVVE